MSKDIHQQIVNAELVLCINLEGNIQILKNRMEIGRLELTKKLERAIKDLDRLPLES